MTWTKLGDEFSDAAAPLSDAAFRTHVEALGWSNRRLLDLTISKRELKRFAETDNPHAAAKELVEAGWWEDRGEDWWIGVRFPEWQVERSVIEQRRADTALRVRRHRMHKAGDHSLCQPSRCNALRDALPGTGRDGAGRASTNGSEGEDREQPEDTPFLDPPGDAPEFCGMGGCTASPSWQDGDGSPLCDRHRTQAFGEVVPLEVAS